LKATHLGLLLVFKLSLRIILEEGEYAVVGGGKRSNLQA
jgi:hypothetical protein